MCVLSARTGSALLIKYSLSDSVSGLKKYSVSASDACARSSIRVEKNLSGWIYGLLYKDGEKLNTRMGLLSM